MIGAANFFLSLVAALCSGLGIGYLLGQKCQKDSKADVLEEEPCPEELDPEGEQK